MKYRKHNCYVLHTVPEDKRLVHQSKDGWEPVCKYLGHDIPEVPYPHQNKDASLLDEQMTKSPLFRQIIKEFKIFVVCLSLVLIVLLAWYFGG